MKLDVTFAEQITSFIAQFQESKQSFDTDFSNVQIVEIPITTDVEVYKGVYTVTPKVEAQSLNTANKFLQRDVEVFAIPFYQTSNNSGGITAYIGSEITYGN